MEIEGRIIQELPMQSGVSKAGRDWKKREWVLETLGSYPRKVKFHVFGDRCDTINIQVGGLYRLSFDLESREFNDRWYTDVSVYAAVPADSQPQPYAQQPMQAAPGYGQPAPAPAPAQGGYQAPQPTVDPFAAGTPNDDLPF